MKLPFLFILLMIAFAVSLNGQTPSSGGEKTLTFLCPPCNLPCDTAHFDKPGRCPTCRMKLFASYPEFKNRQGEHRDVCRKKVACLLFPGVEIIDFSGPWEVFGAAGMEVFSVAASDSVITATMGLKLKPDYTFANAPLPDIVLVPGGGVDPSDTAVVNWIVRTSGKSEHTMSVCTGAFLLAAGGLLDGLQATTNFPAVPVLRQISPTTSVADTVRFVDNGRIITSSGLSSGIDAAFHLVSGYLGKAQTQKIANELEYGWHEKDPFVRGKLADKHVQDFLNALTPFDYEMTEYAGDRDHWLVSVALKTDLKKDDLLQLLALQFERVSAWGKTKKANVWAFEHHGKKWLATLNHVQKGKDNHMLSLKILLNH